MGLWRFLASKYFFLGCLIFTLIFDWTLTVFAIEGGFHDGAEYGEQNPVMMKAILGGNVIIVVGLALGVAIGATLMVFFYDKGIPYKLVGWAFIVVYLYTYLKLAFLS